MSGPVSVADAAAQASNAPHGGDTTPYIMFGLAVVLVIIFFLVVWAYLRAYPDIVSHTLTVVNNCTVPVNTALTSVTPTDGDSTYVSLLQSIQPGQQGSYQVTPGWKGYLSGVTGDQPADTDGTGAVTRVILQMSNDSNGNVQMAITGQGFISTPLVQPVLNVDTYGVSLQEGFNLPVTITGNGGTSSTASCAGPTFNGSITQVQCPAPLQVFDDNNAYVACASACAALGIGEFPTDDYCCVRSGCGVAPDLTCQDLWVPQSYYTTFSTVCPNCMITNCDQPNYSCISSGRSVADYTITFCPNS